MSNVIDSNTYTVYCFQWNVAGERKVFIFHLIRDDDDSKESKRMFEFNFEIKIFTFSKVNFI